MSAWIPTILAIVVAAALPVGGAGAGPCPREYPHNCVNTPAVINFNSLPRISEQIANEKPRTPKKSTVDPPVPSPYTGPTFGTSLGRGAPTVGYQWSLE